MGVQNAVGEETALPTPDKHDNVLKLEIITVNRARKKPKLKMDELF